MGPSVERVPVVIVGAGPVGLVAALLLARAGVRSVVLDRTAGPVAEPRAVHLDDEAQRVLADAGVLGRLAGRLTPMERYELRAGDGRLLHAFVRDRRPLGHPGSVLFHQPDLEAALVAAVAATPEVDLRWGAEVVDVDPVAGTVDVAGTGRRHRLGGEAVLGCDGAASTVRRRLGIRSTDHGFEQTWVVVDLRVDGRPEALRHPQQRCDPRRPVTSVPVGPGRHRLELMVHPGERLDRVARLVPAVQDDLGLGGDVERCAPYRFHAVAARRWGRGRVLLLGDAAHQMPPFLGQGLCSGLRDAANLVWKLALVLRGGADPGLLDTYEAERRPHVAATIRRTAALGRAITGAGAPAEVLRRSAAGLLRRVRPLRDAVAGLAPPPLPPGPLVVRRRGPGPVGRPIPQPPLRRSGATVPGDVLLGGGFALVGAGGPPLAAATAETRALWAALGATTLGVGPDAEVQDPTGELTAWFRGARADVAVVRPDRVVLGLARRDDPAALAALTARVARACVPSAPAPHRGSDR
jgi:3-(3-hydroxy-phenyl)propionate hydroxylase